MTAGARLRHDSVPMRLYHDAKRAGTWDPRALDLRADARDWARLSVAERDVLLRLATLFEVAEECMTRDLVPLLFAVAREGRLEDELFLATFLADEARHVEFFRRILDEVCRQAGDPDRYQTPSFRKLFADELPAAMHRLLEDRSPAAQAKALVAYTLVGEGVLGEAGYQVFATVLGGGGRAIMAGVREGLRLAQGDEERHLAYGFHVLDRLGAEDRAVWPAVDRRMDALVPLTLGIVSEFFQAYDAMPFGLTLEATVEATMSRFAARWASLDAVRRRAPPAGPAAEEAVRRIAAWLAEQLRPAAIAARRDSSGAICTFAVGPEGARALLVTAEVLDHHSAAEIVAALDAQGVPERLRRPGSCRLTCLRAAGKILVQAPPPPPPPPG